MRAFHRILCLPGDGVGPELVAAAKTVLSASGVRLQFQDMEFGQGLQQRAGVPITEEHLRAVEQSHAVLKGPIEVPPAGQGRSAAVEIRGLRFTSANQALRKVFALYANVRPSRYMAGVACKFPGTDMVVVRENIEGMYTGEESWEGDAPGEVAVAIRRISRANTLRVARFAFALARKQGRKKVTAAHKANVLRMSDGLFLECCRQVAKEFPEIEYGEQLADSLLTAMVLEPEKWDVIVCENLYGDLISDLAAGLVGGLGFAPAALYGDGGIAMFEPAHGSAPDIAGKDIVNPISILLSTAMMLGHLGEELAEKNLVRAIEAVISEGICVTRDLGGTAGTQEMAAAIAKKLSAISVAAKSTEHGAKL